MKKDSIKEMTVDELKIFIESMAEGTIVSVEIEEDDSND